MSSESQENSGPPEENARALFEHMHDRHRHIVDRMWTSFKFFTGMYAFLMGFTISMLSFLYKSGEIIGQPIELTICSFEIAFPPIKLLVIFPAIALGMSIIGILDFRRERLACLETIATLAKIEKYLGLHEPVEEKRKHYFNDKYLLPDEFITLYGHSTEDFKKKDMIRREFKRGSQFAIASVFYIIFGVFAISLIAIIWLL